MSKFTQAVAYATGAFIMTMALGMVAQARADGYDPDLMANGTAMCRVLDGADSVQDVQDLFSVFGRQYTVDTVHAVCPEHDLKTYVGLISLERAN